MDRLSLQALIDTAAGRRPADLLLSGVRVVNVFTGRIEDRDVALAGGYIAGFSARAATRTIALEGSYLLPGFTDAHVHVESGMLEPAAWAREVLALGTTAVVADPHEIANVLGAEGIRFMLCRLGQTPLRTACMAPACVPATALETAGAHLDAEATAILLQTPGVIGLGEVMNAPGLVAAEADTLGKVLAAIRAGLPVDGHAPGLRGAALDAYIAAGVHTDHECISPDEAREKLARGMHILLREGSAARNLEALLPVVTPETLPRCMVCTDDRHPGDLRRRGHINSVLARAVELGLDPVSAVRLATLNPARHYGLTRSGAVAPGYRADLVVCPDLQSFRPSHVFVGGQCLVEGGECRWCPPAWTDPWPNAFRLPVVDGDAFGLWAGPGGLPVIGVVPGQIITEALTAEHSAADGAVRADPARDLLKLFVVERYTGNAGRAGALVRGFGLQTGALAASVSHDAHNLIVVGADDLSMARAVNALRDHGGGLAVAGPNGDQVLPLPVAGLMSPADVTAVLTTLERLLASAQALGCRLEEPFMHLAFLALPVIPALKLTDRGLVDARRLEFVQAYRCSP